MRERSRLAVGAIIEFRYYLLKILCTPLSLRLVIRRARVREEVGYRHKAGGYGDANDQKRPYIIYYGFFSLSLMYGNRLL